MKLLVTLLLLTGIAQANTEFDKHSIYKQIVTNHPNIDRSYALRLSNLLVRKGKEYDIRPSLMAAILMQESTYNFKAKNCSTDIPFKTMKDCKFAVKGNPEREKCEELSYSSYTICHDFGIGQINHKTARTKKMNLRKLVNDLEYSVDSAFKVLRGFKNKYGQDEYYWWTRYNSSNPSSRVEYRKAVQRWF